MLRRAIVIFACGAAVVIACEEGEYVFSARRYDPEAACLSPYTSIEVVPGSSVSSTCPLHCLQVGSDTYVTTVCPPLPANATALELDAEACVLARDAGLCVDENTDDGDGGDGDGDGDGGGGEEDAGVDAAVDADASSSSDAEPVDAADAD